MGEYVHEIIVSGAGKKRTYKNSMFQLRKQKPQKYYIAQNWNSIGDVVFSEILKQQNKKRERGRDLKDRKAGRRKLNLGRD